MVREAHRRTAKYKKNIDPELTARKLRALRSVMIDLETPYLAQIAEIERKVKRICEALGVQTYQIAQYINYARQLYSKCKKFESVTLTNEAQYLTTHWVSRGLTCSILQTIATLFGITVTCVPVPPVTVTGIPHFFPEYIVGGRHASAYIVYGAQTGAESWDGSAVVQFFPVMRRTRWNWLGMYVRRGGAVANQFRFALYDSDGNLRPRNLLVEVGPFGAAAGWAWLGAAIDLTLEKGMYFIGWQSTISSTFEAYIISEEYLSPEQFMPAHNTFTMVGSMAHDQVFGPFPNPFGAPDWFDTWVYFMGMDIAAILE